MSEDAYLPKELRDKKELEEKGTIGGKKPVDIIREMNPDTFIPTGAELAKMFNNKDKK